MRSRRVPSALGARHTGARGMASPFGKFAPTASLVAFGDRLLMTSEDGDTFVIKAGPVHEILRTNPIGEPVYASLALAGGTIYIRGEQHLFAIR